MLVMGRTDKGWIINVPSYLVLTLIPSVNLSHCFIRIYQSLKEGPRGLSKYEFFVRVSCPSPLVQTRVG